MTQKTLYFQTFIKTFGHGFQHLEDEFRSPVPVLFFKPGQEPIEARSESDRFGPHLLKVVPLEARDNVNSFLSDEPANGRTSGPALLLAHGAGAGADSMFMTGLASALAGEGVRVYRFEFPYMQKRRADGRKRPPDRQPLLLQYFREQIHALQDELTPGTPVFIGGKSMGGRMASLLAADQETSQLFRGAVCFGYPFRPPGRSGPWRTDHFAHLQVPLAICQGSRDPFGRPDELASQPPVPEAVTLHWIEGGNHDLQPLKSQGLDQTALIQQAAATAAAFIHGIR